MQIRKRKGESFDALLRRFNQRLQASGTILEAKSRRHFVRPISKNKRKKSKLRALNIGKNRQYLEKVGLLKEDARKGYKR
jgi:ribosomal protein S21